jgi:hypothetical protein
VVVKNKKFIELMVTFFSAGTTYLCITNKTALYQIQMIMKSIIYFLVLCLLATQFIACKKDVSKPSNFLPPTAGNIAGTFTISSFVSVEDQTSVLSGFTFMFNENGIIVAKQGNNIFNGTWTLDDSNNTEIKINFSDAPLNQLNNTWHILELTNNHLLLTDDHEYEDADDDHTSDNSSVEFERD